ncbi:MAG: hypothetical protein RRY10_06030, partial [Christensenellaceae bacterium]
MPNQGFAIDNDVRNYFKTDKVEQRVNVNMLYNPIFEPKTINETDERLEYTSKKCNDSINNGMCSKR